MKTTRCDPLGDDPGVLSLSQVTGQDVWGPNGQVLGRVADVTTRLDSQAGPHLVERILVQCRRGADLLMPWAAIESFENTGVLVNGTDDPTSFAITSTTDALGDDEILLVRDVLDTQMIDVVGQRLARVADVVLTRTADDRLELVGVEVGFGGVLRRLGLRRLAARDDEDVVAWTDLHLTSERGHAVQLATPRSAVHHLDAAGLAALVSRLDIESAAGVLAATEPRVAADVVRAAHPFVGERVLRAMPDADAATIVAAMPAEHATRWRDRSRTTLLRSSEDETIRRGRCRRRRMISTMTWTDWAPGVAQFRSYERRWLLGDLVSGLTVAAYLVPQVMAYATLAGLPPAAGLWAAIVPLAAYALFGSSRQLSVGPESTTALMTAAVLTPVVAGDPTQYAALAAALALLVGAICLLSGLARLGFPANLLSRPVLVGYMTGIAIVMIASQLGKITGAPISGDGFVRQMRSFAAGISQAHWPTIALAASVLALLLLLAHVYRSSSPVNRDGRWAIADQGVAFDPSRSSLILTRRASPRSMPRESSSTSGAASKSAVIPNASSLA